MSPEPRQAAPTLAVETLGGGAFDLSCPSDEAGLHGGDALCYAAFAA